MRSLQLPDHVNLPETSAGATAMTRTGRRVIVLLAAVACAAAGSACVAATAAAAEGGPAVTFSATVVDPQPTVAGHEGDVLLQVNVAMPAATPAAKATATPAHRATTKKVLSSRHRALAQR